MDNRNMQRFKCTLEYDGTPYAGWQWQEGQPSAQGALEQAIADFAQEEIRVQCAGRTDAGVHARGQVVHFDLSKNRSPYQVMEGLNHHLYQRREALRILLCEAVSDDFHARFDAISRRYCYRLVNRRAPLTLDVNRAWHVGWPLDVNAMREGAQHLIGKHDFTSFRSTMCQAETAMKTLDRLDIERDGEEIRFHLEARSFLHNQVRIIVGSLEKVGNGKWTADDIAHAIAAKNRSEAGLTAPACGLYLMEVAYGCKSIETFRRQGSNGSDVA